MKQTLILGALLALGCTGKSAGEKTVPPKPEVVETDREPVEQKPDTEILEIDDRLVDCEGEAPRRCMQVRRAGGDWELFYDSIEGFTYEPGNGYKLEVKIETVADPPADGLSLRYTLVKELEKTPAR